MDRSCDYFTTLLSQNPSTTVVVAEEFHKSQQSNNKHTQINFGSDETETQDPWLFDPYSKVYFYETKVSKLDSQLSYNFKSENIRQFNGCIFKNLFHIYLDDTDVLGLTPPISPKSSKNSFHSNTKTGKLFLQPGLVIVEIVNIDCHFQKKQQSIFHSKSIVIMRPKWSLESVVNLCSVFLLRP